MKADSSQAENALVTDTPTKKRKYFFIEKRNKKLLLFAPPPRRTKWADRVVPLTRACFFG
jgi:hypothetical protein